MTEQADVIVLGLGTGGEELAGRLAMSGLQVVGIEPNLVGGECAYWACLPTKAMIRAANLLQEARRVNGIAGRADVFPDWTPVSARIRREITGHWDDSQAVGRFQERGGTFVRGRGAFTGPGTVSVEDRTFSARRGIVIATGSEPAVPPIPGLSEVEHWTSHDAIQTEELPGSLIVLGGGAVGCELGQAFSRFGVEVTIVEGGARLLPLEEEEAGQVIESVFRSEGISAETGSRARSVEREGTSTAVLLDDGRRLTAERLLLALGRTVDVQGLRLDAAGVRTSDGFINVDEHLRAGEGIWALGDVTGKGLFTHVALSQAPIVEAGLKGEAAPEAGVAPLPRATFTDPEVGSVGLSEEEARAMGLDVAVTVKEVPKTFRGWLHGPGNEGIIKLVADRAAGVLVGATAVGPHGGEVLGLLTAAVHARIPLEHLGRMIYAFPTFHGGVGEALGAYAAALVQVLDPGAEFLLPRTRMIGS